MAFVCGWVLTLDADLRTAVLASDPGTSFPVTSEMASALGRPGTPPGLRCRVALVGRQVGGAELVCWAEEFPAVRETLVVSDPPPVYPVGRVADAEPVYGVRITHKS